jgi:HlyD family secretion protein
MKKVIPPIVVIVLIGSGLGYWCASRNQGGKWALYNGILEATEVQVRSEVGGKVVAVLVDEGDQVDEGGVICELDREKLTLQLRGGEGELTAQKARLEAMEKGARDQELAQVKALRDAAKIQREKAGTDYGKIERLFGQEAVSEFERDNARVMRDLAVEQDRRAEQAYQRAEQAYQLALEGVRDEELRAQIAIVDAVEAKVEYYRIQLDDAMVKSPVSGRLIERYVERGELVMPGGLVAAVADYRKLTVKVYIPEEPFGRIKLGQKAEVVVDAFPDRPFTGWVTYKSRDWEFTPKVVQTREERTTLVYEVKLAVENPDEFAIAGLPADVKFLDQVRQTKAPAEGEAKEREGSTVGVDEGDTAEQVEDKGSDQ